MSFQPQLGEYSTILAERKDWSFIPPPFLNIEIPKEEIKIRTSEGGVYTHIIKEREKIKRKPQITIFHSTVRELEDNITDIKNHFSDIRDRELLLSDFKNRLDDSWNYADENKKEILILLMSCIKDLKSENLKIEQLETIDKAIKKLRNEITEDDIDEVMNNLIKSKIKKAILPKGISDLYEDEL